MRLPLLVVICPVNDFRDGSLSGQIPNQIAFNKIEGGNANAIAEIADSSEQRR